MRINSLVKESDLKEDRVVLSPEESHHLVRVLRVQTGQEIVLFDGKGKGANARVLTPTKSAVEVEILHRWDLPPPPVQIDLIQAIPKPDRWTLVMQKAVELGVSNIYPILSEHTEFRKSDKKDIRWQKVIQNAAQQCEVRWIPTLHPVEKLKTIATQFDQYDLVLIASLYPGAHPFKKISLTNKKRVALIIGPEGDFSQKEIDLMVHAGGVPISFGDRILRTETAAIFGLSILAYHLL